MWGCGLCSCLEMLPFFMLCGRTVLVSFFTMAPSLFKFRKTSVTAVLYFRVQSLRLGEQLNTPWSFHGCVLKRWCPEEGLQVPRSLAYSVGVNGEQDLNPKLAIDFKLLNEGSPGREAQWGLIIECLPRASEYVQFDK